VVRQRLFESTQLVQQIPAQAEGLGIVRVERACFRKACQRLLRASDLDQCDAVMTVRRSDVWIDRECQRDAALGVVEGASLKRDDPQR